VYGFGAIHIAVGSFRDLLSRLPSHIGKFAKRSCIATLPLAAVLRLPAQMHGGGGSGGAGILLVLILLVVGFFILRVVFCALGRLFSPRKPRPGSIFISYRRQDSPHITGRIYDRLVATFGKDAVFKDVDNMLVGPDFRKQLDEQLRVCSVVVAVIGNSWTGPLSSGAKRIQDPKDHLRIEVEKGLERVGVKATRKQKPILVVPVLVDNAVMPAEEELPPTLARLPYLNAVSVRPDPDFTNDTNRLIRAIEAHLKKKR